MKRKAIGLCRVSTTGQSKSGLSLEHQRAEITRYAETNGYDLVDVVEEVGSGGKSLDNRPTLTATKLSNPRAAPAPLEIRMIRSFDWCLWKKAMFICKR